jgi:glutaredoxin-related protein
VPLLDRLDRLRDAGYRVLTRGDNPLTSAARRVNDVLGRPLAPADELADRRAFERGYGDGAPAAAPSAAPAPKQAAPVIVYYFKDKQGRDVPKLTEVLDSAGVPYQVVNLDGDEATQAAVRRDAKGRGGPLCFIAGECVGGRVELVNLAQTGELKRRVFG